MDLGSCLCAYQAQDLTEAPALLRFHGLPPARGEHTTAPLVTAEQQCCHRAQNAPLSLQCWARKVAPGYLSVEHGGRKRK